MNAIINATNNATFTCDVAGVPLPSISWTLPNGNQIISQVISSGNDSFQTFALTDTSTESPIAAVSVLYIESVSPGDEGEYTCTAINARNTVSETAILTVQGEDSKTKLIQLFYKVQWLVGIISTSLMYFPLCKYSATGCAGRQPLTAGSGKREYCYSLLYQQ